MTSIGAERKKSRFKTVAGQRAAKADWQTRDNKRLHEILKDAAAQTSRATGIDSWHPPRLRPTCAEGGGPGD